MRRIDALLLLVSLGVLVAPPIEAALGSIGAGDWRTSPRFDGRAYLASESVPVPREEEPTGLAAALATLARWNGADGTTETEVAGALETEAGGYRLDSVREAAREQGMDGTWIEGDASALARVKTPFLAPLAGERTRFVVVRTVRSGYVYALDPGRGHLLFPRDRFAEAWTGRMLAFPDPPAAPRPWR